jgi:hypothetical protein
MMFISSSPYIFMVFHEFHCNFISISTFIGIDPSPYLTSATSDANLPNPHLPKLGVELSAPFCVSEWKVMDTL